MSQPSLTTQKNEIHKKLIMLCIGLLIGAAVSYWSQFTALNQKDTQIQGLEAYSRVLKAEVDRLRPPETQAQKEAEMEKLIRLLAKGAEHKRLEIQARMMKELKENIRKATD